VPKIDFFPFGPGLNQANDELLQDAGRPREIVNLQRTKNGRLCPRRDYETIAMTARLTGGTGLDELDDLQLFDLAAYDDRIVAFGDDDSYETFSLARGARAVFELVETSTHNWLKRRNCELGRASNMRFVAGLEQTAEITRHDVAAGDGFVCHVFQAQDRADLSSPTESCYVHIVRAADNVTVYTQRINSRERPRCVFAGGSFFITMVQSDGSIELYEIDPDADTTLTQLTDPVASGSTIVAYDLSLAHEGTSFWLAFCKANTTTGIRGLSTAGAVTFTTAGPAVLGDAIGIMTTATSGEQRVHVAITIDTTGAVDVVTYEPPSTTPTDSTADMFSGGDPAASQVTLVPSSSPAFTAPGDESYVFGAYRDTDGDVWIVQYDGDGHADVGVLREIVGSALAAKHRIMQDESLHALAVPDGDGFFTGVLIDANETGSTNGFNTRRPAAVNGRLVTEIPDPTHIPSLAQDASTRKCYWPALETDGRNVSVPRIIEFDVSSQERRQTVELGGSLYIAGGILLAYDGMVAGEAGGFLTRPVLTAASNATNGALDLLGVYQLAAHMEYRDANGSRLRSPISNVLEHTLTGANDGIQVLYITPASLWGIGGDIGVIGSSTPFGGQMSLSLYRTLNTDEGNITFHFELSEPVFSIVGNSPVAGVFAVQSDDDISDEEIIYTQGARGALSGPLEFICPDPCITLASSADRILSGGLPQRARFQESRPLFPGEQVQWSDTAGFYRDVRGDVLAVSRLDERRLIFTAHEIFEADGPGLDDNGIGDIGAPRRLPSDVGLYGGHLGWRSMVEISAGLLFQGTENQIYLLPRGGVTPVPVGFAVEDKLAAYPDIAAAVYMNDDQTVRFFCNNAAGDESIVLLFNVRFSEWFVEGTYEFAIRSAARASDRLYVLTSSNTVLRQLQTLTPTTFIATAWRSGTVHPFKPGMFGRVLAPWFYGTFRGNCRIRAIVAFGDGSTETHDWVDVVGMEDGEPFVFRFEFDQNKCESCTVDFEVEAFQSEATRGLDYNYWALETEAANVPNQIDPQEMS
jgi:hypothetical protein